VVILLGSKLIATKKGYVIIEKKKVFGTRQFYQEIQKEESFWRKW
jgi:hypothetical protein